MIDQRKYIGCGFWNMFKIPERKKPRLIKLYGKTLALRRGENLSIHPTFRCNQACGYCPRFIPTGKIEKCKESTLDEWKDFILRFTRDHKIKEVSICGGEPTLYSDLDKLINWILDKGFHVLVLTNLFRGEILLNVKKSYRFKIHATFHHQDDLRRFLAQYNELIKKHRVDVDEIVDEKPKVFEFSKLKRIWNADDFQKYGSGWRIRPDRTITNHCLTMYGMGKETYETQTENQV